MSHAELLRCPVRGCGEVLPWATLACARGHRFDRARSGYVNLLQPQDRKSTEAGDTKEQVVARRRSLERGMGAAILGHLRVALASVTPGAQVLDVGCGEGSFLGHLARELPIAGWGTDLSIPSVDAAARAWPSQRWVVANADRTLPFVDGAFEVVTSITARKNGPELARLLAPGGRAVVVVAAEDDLAELREVLHGQATEKDRAVRTVDDFAGALELVDRATVRTRVRLDRAGLDDILAGTYRGARFSQRERLASVDALDVTSAHHVLTFRATLG